MLQFLETCGQIEYNSLFWIRKLCSKNFTKYIQEMQSMFLCRTGALESQGMQGSLEQNIRQKCTILFFYDEMDSPVKCFGYVIFRKNSVNILQQQFTVTVSEGIQV